MQVSVDMGFVLLNCTFQRVNFWYVIYTSIKSMNHLWNKVKKQNTPSLCRLSEIPTPHQISANSRHDHTTACSISPSLLPTMTTELNNRWSSPCTLFFGGVGAAPRMTCGILVPRPGIDPMPSAVKVQSPNHWTAREFLTVISLIHDFSYLRSTMVQK